MMKNTMHNMNMSLRPKMSLNLAQMTMKPMTIMSLLINICEGKSETDRRIPEDNWK